MLRKTLIPTRPNRVSARRVIQVGLTIVIWYHYIIHFTNSRLALESGVDEMVEKKFEQPAGLKYGPGSTASGSDHRVIPEDEGGTRDDRNRYESLFTWISLLFNC